jgi:hypothetical protein
MNVVFDASAIIAFLRGEPGADAVEHYFGLETHILYVHALNLCEVYYDFLRAAGEASAESAVQDILLLGCASVTIWTRISGEWLASSKLRIAGSPSRIVVLWRWLATSERCSSPPIGTNLNLSLALQSAPSNSFDSGTNWTMHRGGVS